LFNTIILLILGSTLSIMKGYKKKFVFTKEIKDIKRLIKTIYIRTFIE